MSVRPLNGELVHEVMRLAMKDGTFDGWVRRYMETLDREGIVRDYSAIFAKSIAKSGILPADTSVVIPANRRESKMAELNALLEKQNLLSDASFRSFEAMRKNADYRDQLSRDVDRLLQGEERESLKRSRDSEMRYENERDAKRPRDIRY